MEATTAPSRGFQLILKQKMLSQSQHHTDVSNNRGKTTKMEGENNGKPYEQMDDLEVSPLFSVQHPHIPSIQAVRRFFPQDTP